MAPYPKGIDQTEHQSLYEQFACHAVGGGARARRLEHRPHLGWGAAASSRASAGSRRPVS